MGSLFSKCREDGLLMCLKRSDFKPNIPIAAEQTASFAKSGENYVLTYSAEDQVTSEVTLKCDPNVKQGKFMETSESKEKNFKFELRSQFACVQGPPATTTTKATTKPTPKATTKPTKPATEPTTKPTTKPTKPTTKPTK